MSRFPNTSCRFNSIFQRGFSLLSALFLLVVFSALGVFMVNISGTQHYTTMYALQGAKAFQAARAGLEWGMADAINNNNCTATTTLSNASGFTNDLANFQAVVTCVSTPHTEAGITYNVYIIQSVGSTSTIAYGNPGFASRTLAVSVTASTAP